MPKLRLKNKNKTEIVFVRAYTRKDDKNEISTKSHQQIYILKSNIASAFCLKRSNQSIGSSMFIR